MTPNWLVIGAGLTGVTVARLLAELGRGPILVVERRAHVAGNAFDFRDENGVIVHKYGPHIFHTNSEKIWAFLSRFTEWTPYEHRVLASVDGVLLPVPFNFTSMRLAFGNRRAQVIIDEIVEEYGYEQKVPVYKLMDRTSATGDLGRFVYEHVFLNYTLKQWGMRPEELDKSVISRVPVRLSYDDRYFEDKHQAMPKDGYTAMVERILKHESISVALSTEFTAARMQYPEARIVYTGGLDEYFGFADGHLDYRSVDFIWHNASKRTQHVATVNFPGAADVTRTTEFSHFVGADGPGTLVTERPIPHVHGTTEPYYPIPLPVAPAGLDAYRKAAASLRGRVWFAGRLGDYAYYNMDQAVGRGMALVEKELAP